MIAFHPKKRRACHTGFTLGEMLVTVALIGILASLLVPGLQSSRRTAMALKGASNLRQLASAQLLYAGDNNGSYTLTWYYDNLNNAPNGVTWRQRLGSYLNIDTSKHPMWDSKFWTALQMDPQSIYNVPDSAPASKRPTGGASVFINGWMQPSYPGGTNWNFRMLAVPRPAETILLGEMTPETNGDTMREPPVTFNRGGRAKMLMVFCDGHVEELTLRDLSHTPADRPGKPNRWNWWNP